MMEACTVIDLVACPSPPRQTVSKRKRRILQRQQSKNNNSTTPNRSKKRKASIAFPSPSTPTAKLKRKITAKKRIQLTKRKRKGLTPLQKKVANAQRKAAQTQKRKQPPPGTKKKKKQQPPSKKRKLTTDSQPLTLKPPYPYDTENGSLEKVMLSELPYLWLPVSNPCALINEHLEQDPTKVNLVIFVDLDNVSCSWIKAHQKIPANVLVWGFCGGGHNLALKLHQFRRKLFSDNRIFITVCGGGSNSADFGLTYYAGELNHVLPKDIPFAIASNDNDLRHLLGHLKMGRPRAIIVNLKAFDSATYKSLHFLIFRCKRILTEQFPGEGWEDLQDGREGEQGGITSGLYDVFKGLDDAEVSSLLESYEENAAMKRRKSRGKPCTTEEEKGKEKIVIDLDAEDEASVNIQRPEQETEKEVEKDDEPGDESIAQNESEALGFTQQAEYIPPNLQKNNRQKKRMMKRQQQVTAQRRKMRNSNPGGVVMVPVVIDLTGENV